MALLRGTRYSDGLLGLAIAVTCGMLYLALRPPLFDFDGYMYRIYALAPNSFYNTNPHHLLWNSIQILLADFARLVGYPTTVPFQVFGIIVNSTTLFLFYALLFQTGRNRLFAVAGVLSVAFSPRFWYVGFQNQPYPLMFLAIVLYLHAWHTKDGGAPEGWRLVASGLCLAAAIFMQQGAAFLVPAGVLVLMLRGPDAPRRRLMRAVAWGAGVAAIVVPVYLWLWAATAEQGLGFLRWITAYLEVQHSLQFQFPTTLIKTVMGISGAVLQTDQIQGFLEANVSAASMLILYGGVGLLT